MLQHVQVQPARPSTWLLGDTGGIQVWTAEGDKRVCASVLIGWGAPVVLLNRLLVGSAQEHAAISWAFGVIASGLTGFYVWLD